MKEYFRYDDDNERQKVRQTLGSLIEKFVSWHEAQWDAVAFQPR